MTYYYDTPSYTYSSPTNDSYSYSSPTYASPISFGSVAEEKTTRSKPDFTSTSYEWDTSFFGLVDSPPSSNRDYKNFYKRRIERDLDRNPTASLGDLEINAVQQVPDVLARRKRDLDDDWRTKSSELGAGAASAVGAKSVASRGVSWLFGEDLNVDSFGLKEKHRDPAFEQKIRKASGRDFDSLLKKAQKITTKTVQKPFRDDAKRDLGEWVSDTAHHAWDTFATDHPVIATEAVDFVVTNAPHVKGLTTHGVTSIGVAGMHAVQGRNDTKKRLGQQRDLCEAQAKPVHENMARKIARKVFHLRKSG